MAPFSLVCAHVYKDMAEELGVHLLFQVLARLASIYQTSGRGIQVSDTAAGYCNVLWRLPNTCWRQPMYLAWPKM